MDSSLAYAVLVGVVGSLLAAVGSMLGILAQSDLGAAGNTGLLVTGGSASVSATALGYVVRQIVSGKLVHRDVAEAEELNRHIAQQAQDQARTYAAFIERRLDGG